MGQRDPFLAVNSPKEKSEKSEIRIRTSNMLFVNEKIY